MMCPLVDLPENFENPFDFFFFSFFFMSTPQIVIMSANFLPAKTWQTFVSTWWFDEEAASFSPTVFTQR